MLVYSHVLKFLSINLFAVFLIIILIINVLKKALNNFRGHITAKKCLRRPKVVTFFLSRTLVYSRPMQVGTVRLATILIASLV